MTNRKLGLKREPLSALASYDLREIGAAGTGPSCGGTCLETRCLIEFAPSMPPTCQNSLCFCTTD